ncbi:NADH:ubiquinone reductase (Na(+)-transporting) subunit B [Fulvivirgaceae bacterium BMA12]|uniref:Na(+)-translocating NADH-quinone reductase subunit B n=1 Tax=Agaribacillus aureus TaxID=3051825 RepID=A0ABT8L0F2_9BACT|nr:NADH:ubiquinone reductase (Na(+)-transporting) subunit B [Fulvivirgaceae bacterium BMA12]
MKLLRDFLDKQKPHFEKGGKWEKFYYIFEAHETLLYTPKSTTKATGTQIKDAVDMKRMMMTVIIAMVPCLIFGIFNAGYQHFIAQGQDVAFFSVDSLLIGAVKVLPVVVVSYASGLTVEFTFATFRRHAINEGFLVTGMLIPLVMPPTVPLWQVALATVFAVVIGKEAFGGTGMNILNVALTARAFLYFAYPTDLSGDVWTYIGDAQVIDGYSGATALAIAAEASNTGAVVVDALSNSWHSGLFDFGNLVWGQIPGSIGETSVIMALIGGLILVLTGVGSWKIIVSVFGGAYLTGLLFNLIGANTYMQMPAEYHLVIGGLAFGAVFMATDPVTAAQTETGKWIYGFLIGVITVIIRVVNPAYPEGIMMAILLMNVFAPLIDYYIVQANKKRRLQRATV